MTWFHTTYKDTGQSLADAYPNRTPDLPTVVVNSRVWAFFTEVTTLSEVSRLNDMRGWELLPAHQWEALSRLLGEPFQPHEWRMILAMDAKYCDIRNRLTAEAREKERGK